MTLRLITITGLELFDLRNLDVESTVSCICCARSSKLKMYDCILSSMDYYGPLYKIQQKPVDIPLGVPFKNYVLRLNDSRAVFVFDIPKSDYAGFSLRKKKSFQ